MRFSKLLTAFTLTTAMALPALASASHGEGAKKGPPPHAKAYGRRAPAKTVRARGPMKRAPNSVAVTPVQANVRLTRWFASADYNRDGWVTEFEANRYRARRRHARMDLNNDGVVSRFEARRAMQRRNAFKYRGHNHWHGSRFIQLDLNRDGRISRWELNRYERMTRYEPAFRRYS